MRVALAALLLYGWLFGQQPNTAPPAAGSINGTVLLADMNSGVSNVLVTARSVSDPLFTSRTMSDDRGEFSLRSLPSGSYTILAAKPGFETTRYGSTAPNRPGSPVVVVSDSKRISIILRRGAVITGTVRNEHGDRLPGVRVLALPYPIGSPSTQEVMTNQLGEYRLFGLEAGRYAVMAEPGVQHGQTPALRGDGARALVLPAAYHPRGTNPENASVVDLEPGAQRAGVDIELRYEPTFLLKGKLVDAVGQAVTGAVKLISATPVQEITNVLAAISSVPTRADGLFEFPNVAAGSYFVLATSVSRGIDSPAKWGSKFVMVARDDDVTVEIWPTLGVSGQLKVPENIKLAGSTLELSPQDRLPGLPQLRLTGIVGADGRFAISGVPRGRYRLRILNRLGAVISGTTVNGAAHQGPMVAIEESLSIQVEVIGTTASLSGSLLDVGDTPRPDLFVLVFSTESDFWFSDSDRIQIVRPQADGRFAFEPMAPGEYWLVPLVDVPLGRVSWPDFLRSIAGSAVKVNLQPNVLTNQVFKIAR